MGNEAENSRVRAAGLKFKTRMAPSTLLDEQRLPERRGYRVIRNAIDPRDGTTWDIRVSEAKIESIAKRSWGQVKELAYLVPEVLSGPTAVFQGVREVGEKDWLCYCGVPGYAYAKDGRRIAARIGEVYLVFVNADRVAYNFRWEHCDTVKRSFPKDYETRFDIWVL